MRRARTWRRLTVRSGNSGNTVRQNHVRDNGEDGIDFESDTTGNVVTQNSSFGNVMLDRRDDGGADTWEKNQGQTSSPPALCTPNGS